MDSMEVEQTVRCETEVEGVSPGSMPRWAHFVLSSTVLPQCAKAKQFPLVLHVVGHKVLP